MLVKIRRRIAKPERRDWFNRRRIFLLLCGMVVVL
jgi:hypothetical protein